MVFSNEFDPDSWCIYTEGTRTENKFRSRNSKKIGRGGTKEPGWSMRSDKYDGVLEVRTLCVNVVNL